MRDRGGCNLVRRAALAGCVIATLACTTTTSLAQQDADNKPAAIPTALIERRPLVPAKHAAAKSGAPATSKPAEPTSPSSITRTVVATASVLALILLVGWGAKKILTRTGGLMSALGAGGKAPSGVLQVLGRYPVNGGMQLVVLKFDRRVLLIAQSGGKALRGATTMQTLCELTDPSDVASVLVKCGGEEQAKLSAQFQSMLRGEEATMDKAIVVRTPTKPTLVVQEIDSKPAPRTHRPQMTQSAVQPRPQAADSREAANAIRARLAAMRAINRPLSKGGVA